MFMLCKLKLQPFLTDDGYPFCRMFREMVKNLPLLRGAHRSLFSELGIAAPASVVLIVS